MGQCVHSPPETELKHLWQGTHELLPATDEEPAGQRAQAAAPSSATLPSGHGVQAAAPASAKLPALQAAQLALPPGEEVPAAQAWQLQASGSLPAAHWWRMGWWLARGCRRLRGSCWKWPACKHPGKYRLIFGEYRILIEQRPSALSAHRRIHWISG